MICCLGWLGCCVCLILFVDFNCCVGFLLIVLVLRLALVMLLSVKFFGCFSCVFVACGGWCFGVFACGVFVAVGCILLVD